MTNGIPGFDAVVSEPMAGRPLVGYRSWTLTGHGADPRRPALACSDDEAPLIFGTLCGTFKTKYRWGNGENLSVCLRPALQQTEIARRALERHRAEWMPQACACGFWAYGAHHTEPLSPAWRPGAVCGAIEGWGRLVLGPRGFRCQYARIVALVVTPLLDEKFQRGLLWAIQTLYPDVAIYPSRPDMQRAHPASDMRSLLPDDYNEEEDLWHE